MTFKGSKPIFSYEGAVGFVFAADWNPVEGREFYGSLPYIIVTLVSSTIAMAIGVSISLGSCVHFRNS